MNGLLLPPDCVAPTVENIAHLESQVGRRVGNRVRNLCVHWHEEGWLLEGSTVTYHAKQLAQEAVMDTTPLPLRSNRIQVELLTPKTH